MTTFWITRHILLRNLRDLPSMALQIVLPLMVIVILGSTLSAGFAPGEAGEAGSAGVAEDVGATGGPSAAGEPGHRDPYPIIHEYRGLRSTDYYAVTVTVMMVMFGLVYGADSVAEQRRGSVADRLVPAGAGAASVRLGVWIATVLTVVLQGLTIVVGTALFLGVPWWHEFPGVVIVITVIAGFAGIAGVVAGEAVRSWAAVRVIMQAVVFFWTFIAGGFVRFPAASPFLRALRVTSPAYHANRALLAMLPGMGVPAGAEPGGVASGALVQALPSIGVLLLAAALLLTVALALPIQRRSR